MVIVAVIYWSFDRKLGLRLAIFLPVVASLNSLLKQAFHAPRPYWLDPGIRAIHVSNGFGMPSGHAQASTVWLFAASILKRGWFWLIALCVVILIGLSRIYLGVHFSSQVIIGWLIGVLVLMAFIRFEQNVLVWFLKKGFSSQMLLIAGLSALLVFLGGVIVFLFRNWEMPTLWISNSTAYFSDSKKTILLSEGIDAIAGNGGAFMGTAMGAVLSHRKGGFDSGGKIWKRVLRSVSGLVLCMALYGVLMLSEPDQNSEVLYAFWRFIGFFAISISAIFLIPGFLMRLHLLSQENGR